MIFLRLLTPLIAVLLNVACSSKETESTDRQPAETMENRELLNAVKPSLEKAQAVEQTLQDSADARRRATDEP